MGKGRRIKLVITAIKTAKILHAVIGTSFVPANTHKVIPIRKQINSFEYWLWFFTPLR
jgi:hypothetical protein